MKTTNEKMDLEKKDKESKTPTITVIGWVIIFLMPMVLACGYTSGQINPVVFGAAIAMLPAGLICILIGKQKAKKPKQ